MSKEQNLAVEPSILYEYPYPIAKCYEKVVSTSNMVERWDKLRYLFEVIIKYLSCLSIAFYLKTPRDDQQINAALKFLNKPTLGHWLNILNATIRYHKRNGTCPFAEELLEKKRNEEEIISCYNKIKEFLDPQKRSTLETIYPIRFLEIIVSYRNRTAGHGAPQSQHIEEFVFIIERALIALLKSLEFLKKMPLIYLSEIKVERTSFIHVLFKLMGITKVLSKEYVTGKDSALIGFDKQIFIANIDSETPYISLHPMIICSKDDIYLLHSSDLRHNVEYICHHTGEIFTADRIYEDFKETFGSFLLDQAELQKTNEAEFIYETALKMSLVDGEYEEEEKVQLQELAKQLGLTETIIHEIEEKVSKALGREKIEDFYTDGKISKVTEKNLLSQIKTRSKQRKNLLFFPYASVRLGFWADLVSRLAARSYKEGFNFSMLAPDPETNYDAAYMTVLLSDLEDTLKEYKYDIILMAPSPSKAFLELFLHIIENIDVPIMTVDTEFFSYDYFQKRSIPRPPLIQIDNFLGGKIAAEMMLESINTMDTNVHLLIMPGIEDAAHSMARISGFKEGINSKLPQAKVKILQAGGFMREKAYKIFKEFIEDVDLSKYKGIFCGNDEMALGVYKACCELYKANYRCSFKIIGFNNTPEMSGALENDLTGHLLGTIDQNLSEYVDTIFTVAGQLLEGKKIEQRYLIKPHIKKKPE